jgi:hypothetical protein
MIVDVERWGCYGTRSALPAGERTTCEMKSPSDNSTGSLRDGA